MPAKKSKSHKSKSSTKSSVPVASPPIPPRRSKSKGGSLSSGPKKDSHEHHGALHNHLTRRPSLKTVQNQTGGMCQQKICKSLHPRVQALNREISGNKINDFLIERPMPDELKGGILVGKVGDCRGVQNVAYKLERKLNANAINDFLDSRSNSAPPPSHYLKIAPSLAPTSLTLSRRMCQDTVKSLLENRPTLKQLQDYGVVPKGNQSGNLSGLVRSVERDMTRSQLDYLLTTRADFGELEKSGVARKTHVAASLQNSHANVDKHLRRRSIELHLKQRPSLGQVKQAYYPGGSDGGRDSGEGSSADSDYVPGEGTSQEDSDYSDDYSNDGEDLYYEKDVEEDYEDDFGDDEVISEGLGRWTQDDESSSEGSNFLPLELDERMLYAIALRAAAQLEAGGFINHMHKAKLKERILDGDEEIVECVVDFVGGGSDAQKLMLEFQRIAKS